MSLASPSGEGGGISLVRMISTCLRYVNRRGRGGQHPVNFPNYVTLNNFELDGRVYTRLFLQCRQFIRNGIEVINRTCPLCFSYSESSVVVQTQTTLF
jgi:hypothetical protein